MNLRYDSFDSFIKDFNNSNNEEEFNQIIRKITLDIFNNDNENYSNCILDKSFLLDFSRELFIEFLKLLHEKNIKNLFTLDIMKNNEFINIIQSNINDTLTKYNKINDFLSASDLIKKDILMYISNSIENYGKKIYINNEEDDNKFQLIDPEKIQFEYNGTFYEKNNVKMLNIKISKINIFESDISKAKIFIKKIQELYNSEDIKRICANLCYEYLEEWYDGEYTTNDLYNSLENSAMEVDINTIEDKLYLSIWFNLKENSQIDFGGHNPKLELYLDKTKNSCFIE